MTLDRRRLPGSGVKARASVRRRPASSRPCPPPCIRARAQRSSPCSAAGNNAPSYKSHAAPRRRPADAAQVLFQGVSARRARPPAWPQRLRARRGRSRAGTSCISQGQPRVLGWPARLSPEGRWAPHKHRHSLSRREVPSRPAAPRLPAPRLRLPRDIHLRCPPQPRPPPPPPGRSTPPSQRPRPFNLPQPGPALTPVLMAVARRRPWRPRARVAACHPPTAVASLVWHSATWAPSRP